MDIAHIRRHALVFLACLALAMASAFAVSYAGRVIADEFSDPAAHPARGPLVTAIGPVVSVGSDRIVIRADRHGLVATHATGDTITAFLSADTEIIDKGQPVPLSDVAVGGYVQVAGVTQSDGEVLARRVAIRTPAGTPEPQSEATSTVATTTQSIPEPDSSSVAASTTEPIPASAVEATSTPPEPAPEPPVPVATSSDPSV